MSSMGFLPDYAGSRPFYSVRCDSQTELVADGNMVEVRVELSICYELPLPFSAQVGPHNGIIILKISGNEKNFA